VNSQTAETVEPETPKAVRSTAIVSQKRKYWYDITIRECVLCITVDSLRAQLRRAYWAGYDHSRPPPAHHSSDPEALRSLFGIFGK
jgi:hypothetical protein